MFLLAILEFRCIECFAYALASLVLIYFYVCTRTAALLYPISFFFVCTAFLELLLQGPAIVCAVYPYPSFVDPACDPSIPQGGSDETCFYR